MMNIGEHLISVDNQKFKGAEKPHCSLNEGFAWNYQNQGIMID